MGNELKLLPCPFCGSSNLKVFGCAAPEGWREIQCLDCNIAFSNNDDDNPISSWNTRATESADTTREALVEVLRQYAFEKNWLCADCDDPHGQCNSDKHRLDFWEGSGHHGYDIAREALKAIDAEEGKDA